VEVMRVLLENVSVLVEVMRVLLENVSVLVEVMCVLVEAVRVSAVARECIQRVEQNVRSEFESAKGRESL
jgi:hypothetical protein